MSTVREVLPAFGTPWIYPWGAVRLCVGYHPSSDIGSCYDDVDGFYYSLVFDEVFAVSEKAKELEKTIPYDMSFFVTYG